jgi:hypothetical protein
VPSLIVFGSHRGARGANAATEVVKVAESPEEAVAKFADGDGFAAFDLNGREQTTIWINRRLVRMIRDVTTD